MNDEQPRPVVDSDFDPEMIHRIAMHTQARIDARKATIDSPLGQNVVATNKTTQRSKVTTMALLRPSGGIWP